MARESLKTNYPTCIFRETFNSEQSVRENGGVPTAVTFANGVASCVAANSSKIYYPNRPLNGTYSVRLKVSNITQVVSGFFIDFRGTAGTGTGYITFGTLPAIVPSSGTVYINGIASSNITNSITEIIVTGMTISSIETYLSSRYSSNNFLTASYDLFEIYEGTLTASEVKNLYDNDWNKQVVKSEVLIGSELVGDPDFDNGGTYWGTNGNATVDTGVGRIYSPDGSLSSINNRASNLVVGKKYRVSFNVISTNGASLVSNIGGIIWDTSTTGLKTQVIYAPETQLYFKRLGVCDVSIDNVHCQELDASLLLDFDSRNGVLQDTTGLRTLTPTAVNIVRDGSSFAANFNGINSRIDCGADFIGVKPVTVCGWVKANSFGEGGLGRIIDNGRVLFFVQNGVYKLTSTASTEASSASSSISLVKYQFISVTRKLDGKVTFYIGDQRTAPTLSSTADQNSGTPVVGIINVIIGNNSGATRTFDGNIKLLQVYDGILDLQTITALWSSTINSI